MITGKEVLGTLFRGSPDAQERDLKRRVAAETKRIRDTVNKKSGIKCLLGLRARTDDKESSYEYINQLPHEWLCLEALKILKKRHTGLDWYWEPTTGRGLDVAGVNKSGKILVAAECSTVTTPAGTLVDRLRKAVSNVLESGAEFMYLFVISEKTEKKANGIITRKSANVEVIKVNA